MEEGREREDPGNPSFRWSRAYTQSRRCARSFETEPLPVGVAHSAVGSFHCRARDSVTV